MVPASRCLEALILGAWLLPALALAGPDAPTRSELRWEDDTNRHAKGSKTVPGGHREGRTLLEVSPAKKVLLTDSGARLETMSQDMAVFHTVSTDWTDTWSGTASGTGDTMQLDLTLDSRKCTRQETWRGQPTQKLPCDKVLPKIKLTCETKQLALDDDKGSPQGRTTVPAWSCWGTFEDGSSWTFVVGRASCLKSSDSFSDTTYKRCDAARAPER